MSTRTGFLSDENMMKICATHRPVPINRTDLLPARPVNTSGIYSRKLKDAPVSQRPAKASYMLNSVEEITGINVSASYVEQLEKRIDIQPAKMLPRSFGGVDQQTYTNLSSIPDVADLLYRQQLVDLGLTGLGGEQFGELESVSGMSVAPSAIPTIATTEEPAVEPPAVIETAEIGTETRKSQGEYLVEFLRKSRTDRERTLRALLRGYRARGLEVPTDIPNQPSKTETEQLFRQFLDDIYEYDLDFDLDELLQIPTSEALGEASGAVAGPSTLSGGATELA